jgi:hypothetical protein
LAGVTLDLDGTFRSRDLVSYSSERERESIESSGTAGGGSLRSLLPRAPGKVDKRKERACSSDREKGTGREEGAGRETTPGRRRGAGMR